VVKIPVSFSTQDEGATGPSLLGTGDDSNCDVLAMTDAVMSEWAYTYDGFNRLTSCTATSGMDDRLILG
jgi:YD repeat-containing protein